MTYGLVFRLAGRALHRTAVAAAAIWLVWQAEDRLVAAIVTRAHRP